MKPKIKDEPAVWVAYSLKEGRLRLYGFSTKKAAEAHAAAVNAARRNTVMVGELPIGRADGFDIAFMPGATLA